MSRPGSLALTALAASLMWAAASSAWAQKPPAPPAAAASGAAPAAKPPADPTAPKPFADVIKDAKQQDGYLPVWRKDDKVWLEIPEAVMGQDLMFTANVSQSVGERGLYASQMGPDWVAQFRRVGNTLQLVARNTAYRAGDDAASKASVQQAFSDSLLASAPVASAPHPERKSVLVDASFLLSDILGYSTRIEYAFRLPYGLDRGNSNIEKARADAELTTLNVRMHFATPKMPAPPLTPSPVPMPPPPKTAPDARSFFVGVVYSFAPLPKVAMAPRLADPRLGHFTESFTDFSGDMKPNQRVHYITRWRLEKKDPQAALSEPVKPITYWLDRNIPVRYRAAVEAGVLEWNKAFEKIGFKNAVVAKQQADDADFDTLDATHASIRWFVGADVGFAIGPSKADPRSGEILDADIGMSDVFGRGARRLVVEDLTASSEQRLATLMSNHRAGQTCNYAHEAAGELQMALDLLEARGEVAPDSPEAEAIVQQVIKDTIMHEVGHTLGLKHNFKASTTITREQLRSKSFTEARGISGSVMDYNAYNLSLRGEAPSTLNNTTLGPYDYWAIEYAYKPLDAKNEAAELARIAARSTEPALAFADDADADGPAGVDPTVNRFDLGDDPLAWYQRRLNLSRELWQRVQARTPKAGDDPLRTRRVLSSGFRQLMVMPDLVSKYVGGLYIVRELPGPTQSIYKPVEPARQREALKFITEAFFKVDSFSFRPEFLAQAGPDYVEWDRAGPISIPDTVLQLQTRTLDRLMASGTARRVLDQTSYLAESQRKNALGLAEVYGTLQSAVWAELKGSGEVDRMRRNLQREHLKRVQGLLTRTDPSMPADAVSLVRWHAERLQADLRGALGKPGLSIDTRAHLQESLGRLTESLRATMQRS
ncbi:zinc-dependent metalloprotease [Ideonella paludis]|uniref:zinc-dependent metalloprotease n=1 Tax=Ideonella paludis TaxID=1233411 RepID=UPI003631A5D5